MRSTDYLLIDFILKYSYLSIYLIIKTNKYHLIIQLSRAACSTLTFLIFS